MGNFQELREMVKRLKTFFRDTAGTADIIDDGIIMTGGTAVA
ncbi:MAG: hypothetical protein R3B69_02495 [Candidatus Paceibacterota bacterium]